MKKYLRQKNWLSSYSGIPHGWGNGYVLMDKTHPCYNIHYEDIPVVIHGGLTFSDTVNELLQEAWGLPKEDIGMWIVGFDTSHYGDNPIDQNEQFVRDETDNLFNQLEELAVRLRPTLLKSIYKNIYKSIYGILCKVIDIMDAHKPI